VLIVLRGNSGSGKSTVAAALQRALGRPTAVLELDHFRRVIYDERVDGGAEPDGMAHAALLEATALRCLADGQHVVLEGIFNAARYAPMLERVAAATEDARFLAFDLSFEETARRHGGRAKAQEFTLEEMRTWFHGWDPLPFVDEERIGSEETVGAVVERILTPR
jgi:predicted kinase